MKTTVSVIKADIGSVSGHCVAHPDLMDICDEVLAEALDTGILTDYYISRCGDDIDLIMTHRNGEENEEVHKTAYNAFMKATERARNTGFRYRKPRRLSRIMLLLSLLFILNKYYLTSFSGAKVHIFLLTSPEITTKYTKKANFILFYLQFALPLHRFIYINKYR